MARVRDRARSGSAWLELGRRARIRSAHERLSLINYSLQSVN